MLGGAVFSPAMRRATVAAVVPCLWEAVSQSHDLDPVRWAALRLMDDLIQRFEIPTQSCVLTHVTSAVELVERGAPVDLVFQSIAGSQGANQNFGVSVRVLDEARRAAIAAGGEHRPGRFGHQRRDRGGAGLVARRDLEGG